MLNAIKNTLKRLFGNIYLFNPVEYFPLLLSGLSVEFGRVRELKDRVLSATVANAGMTVDAITDYNIKYGIPLTLPGTDQQKIARIIEKSSLTGFPGPDWLEDQLHAAGFLLYVHENKVLTANLRQWGTFQWAPDPTVQWGLTSRFLNPDDFPGVVIAGPPPDGTGKLIKQWGAFQWGGSEQWGTPDPTALNPQPVVYERTTNPQYWGFYFVLSPFPDRLAVDSSEFAVYSKNEYNYLKNLIIELKLLRNRCILQAKIG